MTEVSEEIKDSFKQQAKFYQEYDIPSQINSLEQFFTEDLL